MAAGNAVAALPTSAVSIEFQELLGGRQFHSSPITIIAISFRAKPNTGPLNATIGSLSVYLSTSPKVPNTNGGGALMSSTFADNVGKDKALVFSGTNIPVKSPGCASPGPCSFDLTLPLQTPFTMRLPRGRCSSMKSKTILWGPAEHDATSFCAPGGGVASVAGTAGTVTGIFAFQGNVIQVTYTTTAPLITGVVNVASSIPPGMPNYAIGQGSLLAVYGTNLGPSSLVVAGLPLPTGGLSGTTISIGSGGAGFSAPIFFARSDVVVAVMPRTCLPAPLR